MGYVNSEMTILKANRSKVVALFFCTAFIAINFYIKFPLLGMGAYIVAFVLSCTLINPRSKKMPGGIKWLPLLYLFGVMIACISNFFYVVIAIFSSTDGVPSFSLGIILILLVVQAIHFFVVQGVINEAVVDEKKDSVPLVNSQPEKPEKVVLVPMAIQNTDSSSFDREPLAELVLPVSKECVVLRPDENQSEVPVEEIEPEVSSFEMPNEEKLEPRLAIDKYLVLKMEFRSNPNASFKDPYL